VSANSGRHDAGKRMQDTHTQENDTHQVAITPIHKGKIDISSHIAEEMAPEAKASYRSEAEIGIHAKTD